MAYSLGKTGSCWFVHSITSGEDWSKLVLSESGIPWSVAMVTPLIFMNSPFALRGKEFDFAKLTAMSTIVPPRLRNRITPHKTLQKLTIAGVTSLKFKLQNY